ncbi:P-loop containing nucleoside triphosphate hydrolase protein [Halteromyces radiatus]|uniref:P-loop containing nucleoside triphosphate hydrolase protein n=1 Tax=Halteromyces radiatus TaxID=101107 RepID=UPI00221EDA6A|nr:P-loop containing nucleoside triphosphate hydrolase protein [Halteromyces radiatus]KAI8088706.1 P-loop containing nucleoside triphosphate hydrolase protein [Halteromyces radiatus]
METTAVRVALRIRPLSEKEQETTGPTDCITYAKDEPQIFLGSDRAFTFDHVFPPQTDQNQLFTTSIIPLLDCFLEGNNATVLAYGQTGSGKTYSIGTGVEPLPNRDAEGIIQRFAKILFERLGERESTTTYQIYVSFLELYNEEIIDLFCQNKKDDTVHPAVREDGHRQIYWTGVREIHVQSSTELLNHIRKGAMCRSTGSTDMNSSSSRSHAIVSITLKQQICEQGDPLDNQQVPVKRLVSKFHFVDLAGSERLKRTNALGERQKESISINTGLLALGNVISALGDHSKCGSHIPYRDSKLTRLIQDSLGGNSHTLMLACISPSPSDYMETLNTLKYANRARNIQNRVEINVDYEGSPEEVSYLRSQMIKLKMQLLDLKHQQNHGSYGISDGYRAMEAELARVKAHADALSKDLIQVQGERDTLRLQQEQQQESSDIDNPVQVQPLVLNYLQHIQDLKFELLEANNRLVHLETQQRYHIGQHPSVTTSSKSYSNRKYVFDHEPSISMAVPGRFGSNSPTHRRQKTTLDKNMRMGSVSTGGAHTGTRRTVKQRKHSLPIGHRMKSVRKHTTVMNESTLPDLDELWHFLDSDTNDGDSSTTEMGNHHQDFILKVDNNKNNNDMYTSQQKIADETQQQQQQQQQKKQLQQHDKKINSDVPLFASYSSSIDFMNTSLSPPSSSKLDALTGISISPSSPSTLPDSPISGNTICHDLASPIDDNDNNNNNEDEIQALSVPAWADEPKAQSMTDSTKRESLSWTDSFLDDSDNSIATSRLSSTYWTLANNGKRNLGRRRNKDLLKMLHQVQADLLVKQELVGQLEKSEDEYTQMRINYEAQLKLLQTHLVDMRYQRDYAIGDIEINNRDIATKLQQLNKDQQPAAISLESKPQCQQRPHTAASPSPSPPPPPPPKGLQRRQQTDAISRQIKEIRLQYEGKLKRLTTENQEWKRKYTQSTNSMALARTKAEQVVTKLRNTIDQMKADKKQLQRTMKQDNDRLREQLAIAEQDIVQLKRKESLYMEARKKWDDTNEQQQALLKKRNDHTLQVNQQMRHLTLVLRKAATEGTFLNEVTLERLLSHAASQQQSPWLPNKISSRPSSTAN